MKQIILRTLVAISFFSASKVCWAQPGAAAAPPMVPAPAVAAPLAAASPATKGDVQSINNSLNQKFKVGLSVGWRHIVDVGSGMKSAQINLKDSTLILDKSDRGAVLISAIMGVYPFMKDENALDGTLKWYKRIGFIVNVNLASFGSSQAQSIFNQQVEGGLGLGYILSGKFQVGITYEKAGSRRLRDAYVQNVGQKLYADGQVVTNLDPKNDHFFIDDYHNAISIKFIYIIN
jgi:hypothetical protein